MKRFTIVNYMIQDTDTCKVKQYISEVDVSAQDTRAFFLHMKHGIRIIPEFPNRNSSFLLH